ncbi:MAG TPA: pyridoxamine 5'-phosphate oxidase family protein [Candidatus Omnitrophota bacterium]|nr:pyridoxamine 5'-phosphate oxidase family protein [Candidatus Omnitrophota bacterium]HPS36309.1 pyridoxamine 5'-phosphate oxidase family protein [Candidatus Omnitrophota bacterium]
MIPEKILQILEKREFVSIATASAEGQPNSVPKFFFRAKGSFLYLVDHVIGKTVTNLKSNPLCSVSFMDLDNLEAYRFNGKARLIESGKVFDKILKEWNDRLIQLSTDRVVEAVRTGKRRGHYELEISEEFVVIKIRIESVVKIGRKGDIWKETD